MQKKIVFLSAAILIALFACYYGYYLPKQRKAQQVKTPVPVSQNNQQQPAKPDEEEKKYDSRNATYNMTGYIKGISENVITLEDRTPQLPTSKGDGTPKIIEIKLAKDVTVAKGDEYITLNDLKVGDYVFLKTNTESGELTVKEIFTFANPSQK
jgi:hypothetical protein